MAIPNLANSTGKRHEEVEKPIGSPEVPKAGVGRLAGPRGRQRRAAPLARSRMSIADEGATAVVDRGKSEPANPGIPG